MLYNFLIKKQKNWSFKTERSHHVNILQCLFSVLLNDLDLPSAEYANKFYEYEIMKKNP